MRSRQPCSTSSGDKSGFPRSPRAPGHDVRCEHAADDGEVDLWGVSVPVLALALEKLSVYSLPSAETGAKNTPRR